MTASLRTLEAVISSLGLNSLVRVREAAPIFFGQNGTHSRVIRTSSAYVFTDPAASKSKSQAGSQPNIKNTDGQILSNLPPRIQPTHAELPKPQRHNAVSRLHAAL